MKVLFLSRWYPNEADLQLGVFVEKHARAVALFAEVVVIAAFPAHTQNEKFRFATKSEGNVNSIIVYYRKASGICNGIRYFRAIFKAVSIVVNEGGKPDLIHAHILLRPFLLAFLLSKRWSIPYFITDHWTGYIHGGFFAKSHVYKCLTRFFMKHSSGVSLVSPSLKQAFDKLGLVNSDIRIIPNVVGFPAIINSDRNSGPVAILTVADLADTNKNISGTLSALERMAMDLPDFQFHIVGGGPDEQKLKDLTSSLKNIRNKVIFHGRVPNDQVYKFLYNSDFLIVNSRVETFSVITAEAIACGLPVIATISGGPEFLVNMDNGILIPPEDPEALEEAVYSMFSKYKTYDPIRMRKEIEEKFSEQAVAEQFKQLYLDHLKY